MIAHVVQRAGVRVVQGSNRFRLVLRPGAALRIGNNCRWKDLDGDGERLLKPQRPLPQALGERLAGDVLHHEKHIEAGVAGLVDFAHPACADRRRDLVGPGARSRGEAQGNPPGVRRGNGRGELYTGAPSAAETVTSLPLDRPQSTAIRTWQFVVDLPRPHLGPGWRKRAAGGCV